MQINQDNITLGQRIVAPKPKFFATLQKVGIALTTIGGALLLSPLAPVGVIITTAGAVTTAVSQLPVDFAKLEQKQQAQQP